MTTIFAAAVLAAVIAVAAPASAAELVINGNFETGTFSGWSTTGNVDVGSVPYFGLNSASYSRFLVAFNAGNTTPNGTLSRTITTAANTLYNFTFDYGVTSGGLQSIIASVIDATSMAQIATQTFATTLQSPTRGSLSFTGLSGSTIIRFSDLPTNSGGNADIAVDNVSVTAVPDAGIAECEGSPFS